jgi:hypothetical protein
MPSENSEKSSVATPGEATGISNDEIRAIAKQLVTGGLDLSIIYINPKIARPEEMRRIWARGEITQRELHIFAFRNTTVGWSRPGRRRRLLSRRDGKRWRLQSQ